MFQVRATSAADDLQLLVNCPDHADVLLLVGGESIPFHAHANILSLRCDYYQRALSPQWRSNPKLLPTLPNGTQSDSQAQPLRMVLKHPNFDEDVMMFILQYLYTGIATVADSKVLAVAAAMDELLLPQVFKICLSQYEEQILGPSTAFEYFDRCFQWSYQQGMSQALFAVLDCVREAVNRGRDALASLNEDKMKCLLRFDPLSHVDRWTILVCWVKAAQSSDVSLELSQGLTDNEHIRFARDLLEPLLPCVKLFQFDCDKFELAIAPYLNILPPTLGKMLEAHYDSIKSPGTWMSERLRTYTTPSLSSVCDHYDFEKLKEAVDQEVYPVFCDSGVPRISWKLVYRGSAWSMSNEKFQECCLGLRNTVCLIQTDSGNIVGAFADGQWPYRFQDKDKGAVSFAFIFNAYRHQGGFRLKKYVVKKERSDSGLIRWSRFGPHFGDTDLWIDGFKCCSRLGSCYGQAGVFEHVLFGKFETRIRDYEVFQLKTL
ncbi:hypothetical protein HDU67_000933 [Dinochytrium kinnereticum]|nr:hypothetical protein HDU67_000933 [Dinochytrium kinnereticum]